jgi:hypothetical protein
MRSWRHKDGRTGAEGRRRQETSGSNDLFRNAWPAFQGPVEQTVRPFVDRQKNLGEMVRALATTARQQP